MSRLPTDNIIAIDAEGKWHEIGVAWRNDDGKIALKFSPFVDLVALRNAQKVMVSPRARGTRTGRWSALQPNLAPPPDAFGGQRSVQDDTEADVHEDDEIPF